MKTILEVLNLSADYLSKQGISHARQQAIQLVSDILHVAPIDLYMQFDRPLEKEELQKCREALRRRGLREPLQYIRGLVEFYGCSLKVSPAVLIPRQETEILADLAAKNLSQQDLSGKTLWDVCCGSGCLGIALKKKFPQLRVILADISDKALHVAKENSTLNKVDVEFVLGDLLEPFRGSQVDFLVCNPPYIPESDWEALEEEVKHEPKEALLGGVDGLQFYRRLMADLPSFLKPSGKAWMEIGFNQGADVQKLFEQNSRGYTWKVCRFERDWSENDRFFFLENE
ncbi:peptide chain release factor N(5)-glutamine methyltransferase [Parachlamydia sp. AcF125]|uniref:peptide chain release factor N(5)-glutamine methyltransferase n=1 Tax=Parachlamydia sp. AcF125 TaxID=2795736 RepID=UPI001BC8CF68|nr:peptide chain release factor N(5)-glutamine methyltransferase [Parachlamydia sp. AcF125]MBS4168780.1 Release factor glutamine methyltransferase [Parachlamydia sp. AcF125]